MYERGTMPEESEGETDRQTHTHTHTQRFALDARGRCCAARRQLWSLEEVNRSSSINHIDTSQGKLSLVHFTLRSMSEEDWKGIKGRERENQMF